jgi:hypothetical protein
MAITIEVDPTWLAHPEPLGRILSHIKAVEAPAPWSPPATREPGDDDNDLAELFDGIDDAPEPSPAPPAAPAVAARVPAARPFDGVPTTGQGLYKWACNAQCLPRVNALGKARGWHKLVIHWDADQVAAAYREPTAEPAANGRPR